MFNFPAVPSCLTGSLPICHPVLACPGGKILGASSCVSASVRQAAGFFFSCGGRGGRGKGAENKAKKRQLPKCGRFQVLPVKPHLTTDCSGAGANLAA